MKNLIQKLFTKINFSFYWWPRLSLKNYKRFSLYHYHSRNKELLKITQHFLAITQANAPLTDGLEAMAVREARREKQLERFSNRYILVPMILIMLLLAVIIYFHIMLYDEIPDTPIAIAVFFIINFPFIYILFTFYRIFQNKRHLWEQLAQKASEGYTLGALVDEAPFLFPAEYRAWIHAGEITGNLETSLKHLCNSYETKIVEMYEHRTTFDLLYLLSLFTMTAFSTFYLSMFFMPILQEIISDFYTETKQFNELFYLIIYNNQYIEYIINVVPWIIIAYIIVVFACTMLFSARALIVSLCFSLPYLRQIPVYKNLSTFFKLLGHYLKAGVPLESALGILSESNAFIKPYRKSIYEIQQSVRQGDSLGSAIEKCSNSRLYPVVITGLLHLGDEGGRLPQTLSDVGEYAYLRLQRIFRALNQWIIPVSVLVCGSIVAIYFLRFFALLTLVADLIMQNS